MGKITFLPTRARRVKKDWADDQKAKPLPYLPTIYIDSEKLSMEKKMLAAGHHKVPYKNPKAAPSPQGLAKSSATST